jgi:PilZ domain
MRPRVTREGSKRERRRYPRAITSFSATILTQTRQYSTRIINLSMGGALLDFGQVTPDPSIAEHDRLSLSIRCQPGPLGPTVHLDGMAVLWNRRVGVAPLLAVQFDEVKGENVEILEDLLAEALAEIAGRNLVSPGRRSSPVPRRP